MVQIAGKYKFVKQDNFVEYMTALGLPEEQAKAALNLTNTIDIKVDGSKITVVVENRPPIIYILNEEIEEKSFSGREIVKSVAKLNGDTLTITSKHVDTKIGATRIHKFSDGGLVLTLINDNPKVPQATQTFDRI